MTTTEVHYCECCERKLNPAKIVWMELDLRTSQDWHLNEGELADEDSQGWFPFGATCAAKIVKNGGRIPERSR